MSRAGSGPGPRWRSAILDFPQVWDQDFVALHEQAERSLLYRTVKRFMEWYRSAYFTLVDTYVWRFGARSVPGLMGASNDCVVDPRQIACPLLNVVSEQEYAESVSIRAWAERCEREIPHPDARLVVMPQAEGADSHAIGTNLSLMSQVVFDWLDEVLAAREGSRPLYAAAGPHQAQRIRCRTHVTVSAFVSNPKMEMTMRLLLATIVLAVMQGSAAVGQFAPASSATRRCRPPSTVYAPRTASPAPRPPS